MARKRLARRFEPRGGVSEQMLEVEATYLGREVEDYLVFSLTDLSTRLTEQRSILDRRQQELEVLLRAADERTRLAILCTLYRDFNHMAALYQCYLVSSGHTPGQTPEASPAPVLELTFREWLFG